MKLKLKVVFERILFSLSSSATLSIGVVLLGAVGAFTKLTSWKIHLNDFIETFSGNNVCTVPFFSPVPFLVVLIKSNFNFLPESCMLQNKIPFCE